MGKIAAIKQDKVHTPLLFCWDFDDTIVDRTLPAPLSKMTREQMKTYLESPPILNEDELLEIFSDILSQGHYLAITSFSIELKVIQTTLARLGLTIAQQNKIHIITGMPDKPEICKTEHIRKAKQHFGVANNQHVILIDDDANNIKKAKSEGQTGILVLSPKAENPSYLVQAKQQLKHIQQGSSASTKKRKLESEKSMWHYQLHCKQGSASASDQDKVADKRLKRVPIPF